MLDAPALFEAGADALCSTVVAVMAPPEVRLARIRQRDGLTEAEARRRMNAQPPEEFYARPGVVVLENTGTETALRQQAAALARGWLTE